MIYNLKESNKNEISEILKKYDKINIIYYYSNYCIFCNLFKPLWNKIKTKYKKNIKVNIINVEYGDFGHLKSKYKRNVRGFPTIIKYNNKKKREYKGSKSFKDLTEFIKKII